MLIPSPTAMRLLAETLVSLKDAPAHFPTGATPSCIYHLTKVGVKHNGDRVKLDRCNVGGKLYTSQEAIGRFVAATNVEAN